MAKWIGTEKKSWLGEHAPQRHNTEQTIVEEEDEQEPITSHTVRHIVLRCPKCNSRRVKCYGAVARPVLYYQCLELNCCEKFKVIEVEK